VNATHHRQLDDWSDALLCNVMLMRRQIGRLGFACVDRRTFHATAAIAGMRAGIFTVARGPRVDQLTVRNVRAIPARKGSR
jgi:hypothetical protein